LDQFGISHRDPCIAPCLRQSVWMS
jgi:hypothetical protein